MSRTSEIYKAYLENWKQQHQNVVQPTTAQFDAARKLAAEARKGTLLTAACKFWNSTGEVYLLADGRVVEIVLTSSRLFEVCATFATEAAWREFDQPMSFKHYFERW